MTTDHAHEADRITLRIGYSPDPDDAFMWWPLLDTDGRGPRFDTAPFRFVAVTEDIETLNRRAVTGELEITAMSCAQYASVADRYALTACGASMGDAYGPKLVAREPVTPTDLNRPDVTVLIPGEHTSAYAALRLLLSPPRFRAVAAPFEEIIDRVAAGEADAGLVIHEGQLTFADAGLHLVQDLGAWWTGSRNLPLPLGVNTVRRDLEAAHGPGTLEAITTLLLQSVEYALAHREEGLAHALEHARGMDAALADEFVALYVNAWTLDFGPRGREAVGRFLGDAAAAGLVPDPGVIEFIAPASSSA